MIKYQIVKCTANNLECSILSTFLEYALAMEYLNKHIKEQYQLGSTYKCYHESENVLTIFKYNYLWPKDLVAKFHIIEFEDATEDD